MRVSPIVLALVSGLVLGAFVLGRTVDQPAQAASADARISDVVAQLKVLNSRIGPLGRGYATVNSSLVDIRRSVVSPDASGGTNLWILLKAICLNTYGVGSGAIEFCS